MKYLSAFLILLTLNPSMAQMPGGKMGGRGFASGRLYGKVLDAKNKQAVEFASVALLSMDDKVVTGGLVKSNGDFSLDNLPMGTFKIKISFLGYKTLEQKVTLTGQNSEKDLGNIKLSPDEKLLKEVEVSSEKATMQMSIDHKVYNVDKDISARGGTGLDAVKNIPSVSVDADGNVQLRNNSAQVYVDGRPTTLNLQQIPADQIDRVEVITNPSVKFDAATTGGILNVVMKKNNKPGYNGMVTSGIGTNNRLNEMANLNVKQGKFNFSAMYSLNTQTNHNDGFTNKTSLGTLPDDPISKQPIKYYQQHDTAIQKNTFQFGRLSVDYFMNNRNTLTVSGNLVHGQFGTADNQYYTYTNEGGELIAKGNRFNDQKANFTHFTGQINFKHTFPKQGKEFTTDLTLSTSESHSDFNYTTYSYLPNNTQPANSPSLQYGNTGTPSGMYTYQADFINPLNDSTKLEMGVRSYLNNSSSAQKTQDYDYTTQQYIAFAQLSNNYQTSNMINAAYINYSSKKFSINYQGGLRFEQTFFKGRITDKDLSFSYFYPEKDLAKLQYCFFPAIYLSKNLKGDQQVQVNFSRKINRPNFFQVMPFIMHADNANIRIGNPSLQPEFQNIAEANYNITRGKVNFLSSVYLKYIQNPITNVAYPQAENPNVLINTFQNGDNSTIYGWDNTIKVTPLKNLDLTANLVLFHTKITWQDSLQLFSNSGYSYLAKGTISYRFPKGIVFQANGTYHGPQIIPQGTQLANKYMDLSLSKSFYQKLTFTATLSDVFNTKRMGTDYVTADYLETLSRRRESRYFRFSVTYLFGKMDASLFKRKPKVDKEQMNAPDMGF